MVTKGVLDNRSLHEIRFGGMKKIGLVGSEHMGQSLSVCLEKMGNIIAPIKDCDVCWIAIDTPVNQEGQGNIESIFKSVKDIRSQFKKGTLVIVSSQIPVGTSKEIIKLLGKKFGYAYMPEHMRVGAGISDFMNLTEVVVGIDDENHKDTLVDIFHGKKVVFTNVASAEMIKHANNAFLATSLCFIYDIADICEAVGADVTAVARALRSDYRIGKEAYLDASAGFSGGHLERDLDYLQKVARSKRVNVPVINAVIKKNAGRRKIIVDKLGNVKGKKIAFWGITYKPGVPPSNSSLPAKVMRDLSKMNVKFNICDPWFDNMDPYESVKDCVAIVCITPWQELRELDFKKVSRLMIKPKILFDARNFFGKLEDVIKNEGIKYIGVGR